MIYLIWAIVALTCAALAMLPRDRALRILTGKEALNHNWQLGAVKWMALIFSPIWLILVLFILYALLRTGNSISDQDADDLRWSVLALVGLLTALGGLLGIPLALIRVWTTERQTVTAEQGHITDRINAAVKNLGEDKNVSRFGRYVGWYEGEKSKENFRWEFEWSDDPQIENDTRELDWEVTENWEVLSKTQPNLEVRIGAIYALARIAEDSHRDHVQIMKILCAYIRQNAPAPTDEDNPHHVFWGLVSPSDRTEPIDLLPGIRAIANWT
ncbi:hypothetical protein ILP92_10190, partial [Maribius pontilimi]|nr:hypothetical protein [Palleronia pontilimi]